jgi:predicted Zn-dependent peptidase
MNHNSFHQYTLSNGIKLLLQENHTVARVAARIFLKNSGSRWENRENSGLFYLLSRVITKGTERYRAEEIAEKINMKSGGGVKTYIDNLVLASFISPVNNFELDSNLSLYCENI